MVALTTTGWALLAAAALLIGVSKTALPGAATISVAAFAAVLPARESTAALLVLLIVGDLVAVWTYRRDVDIKALLRLALDPVPRSCELLLTTPLTKTWPWGIWGGNRIRRLGNRPERTPARALWAVGTPVAGSVDLGGS